MKKCEVFVFAFNYNLYSFREISEKTLIFSSVCDIMKCLEKQLRYNGDKSYTYDY